MTGVLPERLLPGDRIPDVRLHGGEGPSRRLHAEYAGAPLWLAKPSSSDLAAALPPVPPWVKAICVAPSMAWVVPHGWLSFRVDSRWLDLLASDVLVQADANLRVQASHILQGFQEPVGPMEIPTLDAGSTRNTAPVLQIPDVFEAELCSELIQHFENDCAGGEVSKVLVLEGEGQTLQVAPSIKQRRESPPRDAGLEGRMHERLMRRALPEIARVFNFPVNRRDPFKLLSYPDGAGYFRAHRDNETPDVAYRRFALSVNLNHGEYVGGEFRFPEFGPHRYSPLTGSALVFSCSLLHEVLPVQRGIRYAMTTFLS